MPVFGYGAVFLLALRGDRERVIRQRALQRERLRRVRLKPSVDPFRRRQNDRHGLRMDRRDDRVGPRRTWQRTR